MLSGQHYIWSFVGALLGSTITALLTPLVIKLAVDKTAKKIIHGAATQDSFVAYLNQFENIPLTLLADILRRATRGKALLKPVENMRLPNEFDTLHFNPVKTVGQMSREEPRVNTAVTIGAGARRPLYLDMPLLLASPLGKEHYSPMVKEAFLQAAGIGDHALFVNRDWFHNARPGPARGMIWQLAAGETLAELPLAQAGLAAVELTMPEPAPGNMAVSQQRRTDGRPRIQVWQHSLVKESDLHQTIGDIKNRAGVPILVRIRTSDSLEINLEKAIRAGADAVVLEGAEHTGMLLPNVVGRDFGLSLPLSLARARAYLQRQGEPIGVIAHGRFWEPADCVKALALGASAVILDSVLIYGMLADQITKAIPWFPIESLLQEGSKRANKLDVERAALNIGNLLTAFREEIIIAAHALGKIALADLNTADVYTPDPLLQGLLHV
ncbi:MAG: glutamate synthase-related protein [Syntrophomonadaceae bacterium]